MAGCIGHVGYLALGNAPTRSAISAARRLRSWPGILHPRAQAAALSAPILGHVGGSRCQPAAAGDIERADRPGEVGRGDDPRRSPCAFPAWGGPEDSVGRRRLRGGHLQHGCPCPGSILAPPPLLWHGGTRWLLHARARRRRTTSARPLACPLSLQRPGSARKARTA